MTIRYIPIKTATAWALRNGTDAYGLKPEQHLSSGEGTPCRHCLKQIPKGAPYLALAHRPFTGLNPYTETGPIFLCADDCAAGGPGFPLEILTSPNYITRGYCAAERIVYGTGATTPAEYVSARCAELLSRDDIAFVDICSASNNCFLCRVIRA